MSKILVAATALVLSTTTAQADQVTDAVLAKFQERDFDYIEIKEGLTQLKVEAIRGDQKLEVIYDRETGSILKQEQERADADEIGRTGVDFQRRNEDFLDDDDLARNSDDDDDDDRRSGRDYEDEDEDDRSDSDSDDDDDDDEDDDDSDDDSDDDDDDDDSDDDDDDDD